MHWKRAPARVRRWAMPDELARRRRRPPRRCPAPRSRPGGDHRVVQSPPSWTWASTPEVGQSAPAQASPEPEEGPGDVVDPERVAGRAAGRRSRAIAPGSTSTAPPPLRRRTTSIPAAAAGGRVDDLVALGAAEHERRRGGLAHPDRPLERVGQRRGRGRRPAAPAARSTDQGTVRPTASPGGGTAPTAPGTLADGHHHPGEVPGHVRAIGGRRIEVSVRSRSRLRTLHGPAGGHHVVPGVAAAAAARDHVVDALGRRRRSTGSGARRGRRRPAG